MRPFSYARPATLAEAQRLLSATARPKGGGNDLLDLAKRDVSVPETIVDVRLGDLPDDPRLREDREVVAGATTLAAIAEDRDGFWERFAPAVRDAALAAATPQIRSTATVAGNLLQRPRCPYFRDPTFDCLKRGGATCPARDGVHDDMAIFGNAKCCAVHASNLATAFLALDATAHLIVGADASGRTGVRTAGLEQGFFVAPEEDPTRESRVGPAEILWFLSFPERSRCSAYAEIDAKRSFDWASVACAVCLDLDDSRERILAARVALGAVAPVPFRSKAAEDALRGKALRNANAWAAAAAAATEGATPLPRNGHKVAQLRAVVRRAIEAAAARAR